jgi:hypothetical protein
MTTTPTATQVADILGNARAHIVEYGFCKKYLYDTNSKQPLNERAVDLDGAILVAVHGTPRHPGDDPLVQAAVAAVLDRTNAPALGTWCDYRRNGKKKAIALLRDAEERLRRTAAAA